MDLIFLRFAFAGSLLSILIVAVGHWFPWPRLIKQPLPLLWRYVYGVLSIIAGFVLAVLHTDSLSGIEAIVTLIIVASLTGLVVIGCHGIDKIGASNTDHFSSNYRQAYDELRDERD